MLTGFSYAEAKSYADPSLFHGKYHSIPPLHCLIDDSSSPISLSSVFFFRRYLGDDEKGECRERKRDIKETETES
ncbi:hypothetical protein KFK09_021322 [Dendrobium nobile]|uniref:Uncharacterized protein n=1 Tax=Dendrobium nobile TaxID=94219 RepID=A0A8T3APT4_DENNO|nr:hypothetical protein KFK09_021322 [Dendrobium nobile]